MATIKLGAIVTDIKGKLGGHVFKGGGSSSNVLVTKTSKTNGTSRNNLVTGNTKVGVRAVVYSSQLWRTLLDSQRQGWRTYASSRQYKNAVGDNKLQNGFQAFRKAFCLLNAHGLTIPFTPPPLGGAQDPGVLTSTPNFTTTLGLFSTANAPNANNIYVIGATASISKGVVPPKNSYTNIYTYGVGDPLSYDLDNLYIAAYGSIPLLFNIWFEVYAINTANATISPRHYVQVFNY